MPHSHSLLSREPFSSIYFVIKTSPSVCTHSDTIFPTTWPQREFASIRTYKINHPIPVITKKMLNEWPWIKSRIRFFKCPRAGRLSSEPRSKKYFVATMITSEPLQSAIAFPKNEPKCLFGSDLQ